MTRLNLSEVDMKKSVIASLVVACTSLAGQVAVAQTGTGTGAVVGTTPQTITLTNGAGYFGDVFAANNAGATFSDRFNFNVTNAGTGTGTGTGTNANNLDAIVSSISGSADTGLAITGLSLYNADGTSISSGTSVLSGATDVWTVHGGNLTAGNYYLQVSGNLVGSASAAFGGALSMAAPVPEPDHYGMMLGGLTVLGLLARYRKVAKRD